MSNEENPLTTEELADRWKMKAETLEVWRQRGKGPKYLKLGEKRAKVLYPMAEVLAYEESKMKSPGKAQPASV